MADQPSRSPRRVTLAEVADKASVSTALASIVIRDAPGASADSRARILAVANRLGYSARCPGLGTRQPSRPTSSACLRAAGRTTQLIDGLYTAAGGQGWDLVSSALDRHPRREAALDSLHDFRFDALIMLGPEVPDPLLAGQVPLVVVGCS